MEAFWKNLEGHVFAQFVYLYNLVQWRYRESFMFWTRELLSLPWTVAVLWVPPNASSLWGWSGTGQEHHQAEYFLLSETFSTFP